MNKYMEIANENANVGMLNNEGGPFGAVIVDKDGKVISTGNNQVFKNNDPTAHAEVQAIRNACKKLNTYDLSGYILYTSCEPCPMCFCAIVWANIKEVYYGATRKDAASIGFRDDALYNYLKGKNSLDINLVQIDHEECSKLFEKYKQRNGMIHEETTMYKRK